MMATPTATIKLDEKDVARFMTSIDKRQLSKAVLRGSDCALQLVIDRTKRLMDAEEPPYMLTRRKGLLRDYRRWASRMRGRFVGQTVLARSMAGGSAVALELGGIYEQFVHDYERAVTRQSRGEQLSSRRVKVRGHRRERTESARTGAPRHYLQRAVDMAENVAMEPTARAVEAVFSGRKVPAARTLRRGL
jgi:hypothetical protein